MRSRYLIFFSTAFAVLALDQLTKRLAIEHLSSIDSVEVIPGFFNLVLVHNFGAAFGMFNDPNTTWQIWLFLGITLVTMGIILHLLKTMAFNKLSFIALALILGGAFGNLVDRIRYQAVVDFLDFYIGAHHWPAFNVADIAICTGAGLTILMMWFKDRSNPSKKANKGSKANNNSNTNKDNTPTKAS